VQSALPVEAGIPFGQTQTFASQNSVPEFRVNPRTQDSHCSLKLIRHEFGGAETPPAHVHILQSSSFVQLCIIPLPPPLHKLKPGSAAQVSSLLSVPEPPPHAPLQLVHALHVQVNSPGPAHGSRSQSCVAAFSPNPGLQSVQAIPPSVVQSTLGEKTGIPF